MRALTVEPGRAQSGRLDEVPEPAVADGGLLVRGLAVGICGTDLEILSGAYGTAPTGRERLILGHESLGRVETAPEGSGFAPGDLVVGIVRRPDPVPCPACGAGEWDMCRNGRYVERGIKERDGYASERFRLEPDFALKLDPSLGEEGVLLEPTSIVAKAWEHIERIGHRASWSPRRVLVTGAGPVGLLAGLLTAQRGYELHVFDRMAEGPKPDLVRALGGTYHSGSIAALDLTADIVIECTGAASVILGIAEHTASDSIICLAGVSSGGHRIPLDVGALNRTLVLGNDVIFGSVNANRRHYEAAAAALAKADRPWLTRLISRRVPLSRWQEALARRPDDVKVVLDLTQ